MITHRYRGLHGDIERTLPPTGFALGLVGQNIAHTLSPKLHAQALAQIGVPGSFVTLDCKDDQAGLIAIARLRAGEFHGLNVTTPFKILARDQCAAWLGDPAGIVRKPASVNTLLMQDGQLCGTSTDGAGLVAALRRAHVELVGKRALLIGAGGAAQAVAPALVAAGLRSLVVTNRSDDRAKSLVATQPCARWLPWGQMAGLGRIDLILHATSVGHGRVDLLGATSDEMALSFSWLPWDKWAKQGAVLADLVYAPTLTAVQLLAQQHGFQSDIRLLPTHRPSLRVAYKSSQPRGILCGFGQVMLGAQAALSFWHWTGAWVNVDEMLAAVL